MKYVLVPACMGALFFFTGCSQESNSELTKAGLNHSLKIAADDDPQTLDPRQARDITSVNYIHMLFEGLMRSDFNGKLVPALAEAVDVSDDLRTYTFKLRKASWSNGDPVTAEDFEYSWKSILNPNFAAPNAYQFYVIKGAKAAKEGKGSIKDVGIEVSDPETLIVTLENPTPYFLELLAFHPFFPVNSQWVERHPSWNTGKPDLLVTNGPYKLKEWRRHNELTVEKNPAYWDAANVQIENITAQVVTASTSYQLFETGKLDWTGSPIGTLPTDALASLKEEGVIEIAPAAATNFLRVNTEKPPLNNAKFRQALAYAIDRKGLVDHVLKGNQTAATALVPPNMKLTTSQISDNDKEKAKSLFKEALKELNLTTEQLQPISLCYASNERTHQVVQAIQQQWKDVLGLSVKLDTCEQQVFFDRLKKRDYAISSGGWSADFRDPINFLEVFKFKTNGPNNTQWENANYIALLDKSTTERDPEKRRAILSEAETLLLKEMPIIPLYHASYVYTKRDGLQGVYFSDLGYLDFKEAYIDNEEETFE